MFFKKCAFGGLLLCVVVLAAGATRRERTFTPGWRASSWPSADGFSGTHYSPLRDITAETVEYLEVAWTYQTGDVHAHRGGMAGTAFEATPIMVDGVLYVATPYSRAVALDAETGPAGIMQKAVLRILAHGWKKEFGIWNFGFWISTGK